MTWRSPIGFPALLVLQKLADSPSNAVHARYNQSNALHQLGSGGSEDWSSVQEEEVDQMTNRKHNRSSTSRLKLSSAALDPFVDLL